jgi:hypothetical protein
MTTIETLVTEVKKAKFPGPTEYEIEKKFGDGASQQLRRHMRERPGLRFYVARAAQNIHLTPDISDRGVLIKISTPGNNIPC